ncbi:MULTISPECIES: RraA family protein [Achromobacter]|jgi:regulator of RNase E activity RraA|uniref:Putative 4-hydroxy-4-methyl-2-oxoglutarate aldolase n=1 Tax=Achromobacter spanius TaxID=217203 RepID=A0AA42LI91_9BURK|nr:MULTISPECIES: RraA family protein [Achromobacter]MCS3506330.1 regulator of RNase E activity RraA [Achromobacter sp. JUb104]MDH0735793.1 RraA family protein [Achromobacter spanius]
MSDNEQDLLARCAAIGTSTWADAMDALGIAGVVQGIARRSGQGRIAGFAVTARHVWGGLGDFDRADFAVGRLVAATGPGRVLMVDAGGTCISTFGGIASLAASRRQATAVVIDGACRDVDEIQATGLWLASRHVTPLTGKTRLRLQAMGEPVTIGQLRVAEGDLVVGDDTGLVVVPRERLEAVLAAAQEALAVDERVEQGIRDGLSFADAAAAANYIPARAGDSE